MKRSIPEVSTRRLISAYPDPAIRLYCRIRFRIIRRRFLNEISQYLPTSGLIYEIGCGFGLFSVFFAAESLERRVVGLDIDEGRIGAAQLAAAHLGLDNVEFRVEDAAVVKVPAQVDAIYMLDILHHVPRPGALRLLRTCYDQLVDGGVLMIKDVDTRPAWKMWFTWLLDVLMTGGERPEYWAADDLVAELRRAGFEVYRHAMVDVLPYPHQLFICTKPNTARFV